MCAATVAVLVADPFTVRAETAESVPEEVSASASSGDYVVQSGDSLWTIARAHDCGIHDLVRENGLDGNTLHPGDTLTIPRCEIGPLQGPPAPISGTTSQGTASGADAVDRPLLLRHRVASGDSLYDIARRYDCSVGHIKVQNGLAGSTIYAGQELEIIPGSGKTARVVPGQSRGTPQHGRLVGGVQLPEGAGYFRRRPHYAWGANHVVGHVRNVIEAVRRRYPRVHPLAIGDFSAKAGGEIPRHNSHESGRDVDLGFYFERAPSAYPEEFAVATADNLDFEATWSLLTSLAATEDLPGGVEVMFVNYRVQKLLYRWAHRTGSIPEATVERLLQYPDGRYRNDALIRHEPGHLEHVHVRFKCPDDDDRCRS